MSSTDTLIVFGPLLALVCVMLVCFAVGVNMGARYAVKRLTGE